MPNTNVVILLKKNLWCVNSRAVEKNHVELTEFYFPALNLKRNYQIDANKVSIDILCQLISHTYSINEEVWKSTSQQSKYFEHLTIHDSSCQATDHIN